MSPAKAKQGAKSATDGDDAANPMGWKWPTWLRVRAKNCEQCLQSTHSFERDLPDGQQYLIWMKTLTNKDGVEYPCGSECYRCFDTRRAHFSGHSVEALKKARVQCREVDNKYASLRAVRARGEKISLDAGQVDVQAMIEKTKKDFNSRCVEGTFMDLRAFCEQQRLTYCPPSDEQGHSQLVSCIKCNLRLAVARDANGTLGVEIMDHNLVQYRFRRGVTDEVASKQVELYQVDRLADGLPAEQLEVLRRLISEIL